MRALKAQPVESRETLAALRQRVKEKKPSKPEPEPDDAGKAEAQPALARAAQPAPKPRSDRKFEAGRRVKARDVKSDLSSAVGGATATKNRVKVRESSETASQPTGPTTSRLLDAKRRAQERLTKEEDE